MNLASALYTLNYLPKTCFQCTIRCDGKEETFFKMRGARTTKRWARSMSEESFGNYVLMQKILKKYQRAWDCRDFLVTFLSHEGKYEYEFKEYTFSYSELFF